MRFLTTHAGSLPRPEPLAALHAARSRGESVDVAELERLTKVATLDIVAEQVTTGLDVINDGEVGRESFVTYLQHRLSGFGGRSERRAMADLLAHPDYVEILGRLRGGRDRVDLLHAPRAEGDVFHLSAVPAEQECARIADALLTHVGRYERAFVTAPSPGIVATVMQNAHYDDLPSYVGALSRALAVEYRTIASRGFLLQIDAPDLALERHTLFHDKPLADFLDFVRLVVGAINDALETIPREQVRLHVCWGNYEGPHDQDVALADIWPELEKVNVGGYLLSMANPRHAHEHRYFVNRAVPPGVTLVPGVIDTTTNYVEHPEVVADRIVAVAEALGDPTRIVAGTDCGLETSAGSSMLAASVAWKKLASLVAGARIASERVFGASRSEVS